MANYHLNITQLLPQLSMYKPVCFCKIVWWKKILRLMSVNIINNAGMLHL